jgi:hypothetical protein
MTRLVLTLLLYLWTLVPAQATELAEHTYTELVDRQGGILLPAGFRQSWVHLGSWLVEDEKAPGYGLHDVYTQPAALAHYLEHREFPDGAVLVKEVRAVKEGLKTTGQAQWAGDTLIWFVMVKDASRARFPGNPHWGLGWGWALYEAGNPGTNISESYRESCQACHMPAKENDWVFIEGYPGLSR